MSVLPGYVRFDDGSRVKINLNSRSKSDIKHLKRKLANELDQVRSLRKKLDSKEKFQSSFNDNFNNRITGNSVGDRIGTLDRANSEVSYVGQKSSEMFLFHSMRTLGGTDSLMKAANTATDQGRASVSKKPEKDTDKRKMTYEEKQELSISLQNLPPKKLESAVQIIRKRNPGLFQQEDEIEVDIDSFDNETLWELHSHVNNYQKSISRNDGEARVVLQDRKEADHNMLGTKLTSATAEAPKDLGSVQVTLPVSSPIKEHKQGHCMSRSSSSSSSFGCGSRSSSSGSDIDSSSDAGR
ncbi:hypothetical protein OIU84_002789 [Salix udensis]|uniref:NET domain-containing protein n=1 Tax=Salix udensis TaxID=889485 RepID=A0AAD6K517_9ROSI|nr:hypothetical protein OIU84_002789 [Salix udensis]